MKRITAILTGILVFVLLAIPVLAATYKGTITITETNSTDHDSLPLLVEADITGMVDEGFILATGLDTLVENHPHMLSNDKIMFVADVEANKTAITTFTTGNSELDSFCIIVGYGGSVTLPSSAVVLGDTFEIEVKGYINTANGSDKDILFKLDAFRLYVSDDEQITAAITGGNSVTVSDLTSKEYIVLLVADGINMTIYIDGFERGSDTLGCSVPINDYDYILFRNNVTPYVKYFKVSK